MIMDKEVPLKEQIEKLYESGYVNEFNYLENQLQEARYLVTILHKQTEEKDKEIERLTVESTEWESKCYKYQDIITELEKILYKRQLDDYDTYTANVVCDFQSDFKEILEELKEGKE